MRSELCYSLSGNMQIRTTVFFKTDNAKELESACHQMPWVPEPTLVNRWPFRPGNRYQIYSGSDPCNAFAGRFCHQARHLGSRSSLWHLRVEPKARHRRSRTVSRGLPRRPPALGAGGMSSVQQQPGDHFFQRRANWASSGGWCRPKFTPSIHVHIGHGHFSHQWNFSQWASPFVEAHNGFPMS